TAERAMIMGLVNRVVEPDWLEKEVMEFANKLITSNSASSMMLTKKLISELPGLSLNDALDLAANMNAKARSTEDCKRGIEAFLNKEKIIW
ncbi:MAG: enoyl-CoA hydratase-related protein, partial [Cyclobacteriaceae bacterium]|nr:enoyl-CoA hydratase-related protein [Cyclobacteriaceae bacterium]